MSETTAPADTTEAFPVESRVVLHDLVKSPDLNGKMGIVRSHMNPATGRQTVYLPDDKKTVGLKPSNLHYEPRTVESLSIKELKQILKAKGVDPVEYSGGGIDKADLRSKVSTYSMDENEIPKFLAVASASSSTTAASSAAPSTSAASSAQSSAAASTTATATQAAEQLANMSPEALRQQAQMMRSMDPNMIRRMNPQLANASDAQILMAANQMEMMANNPDMMKMATEQMKNMDPAELQRMQNQMNNGGGGMPNNPMAATGSNPSAAGAGSMGGGGGDPAKMLANMDKEQLKQVIKTVKDDPEMLKQYAAMTGTSEEQLKQGMEAFAGMSDAKMDAALKMMQTLASAKEKWNQYDAKTGGRLLYITVASAILTFCLIVWYFFFRTSVAPTILDDPTVPDNNMAKFAKPIAEEEFVESEF